MDCWARGFWAVFITVYFIWMSYFFIWMSYFFDFFCFYMDVLFFLDVLFFFILFLYGCPIFFFTAGNISLALRGSVIEASITPVTDEAQETFGVAGELIPFEHLPDLDQTITVKDSPDTVLVEGDDHQLMKSGIQVIEGGGIDDQGIKVSYTPLKANTVQALVESGRDFTLFMKGLNDAQEGLPFNIRVHRVKFSPVQNLGFISDDFASIPLQVDVLADTSISGNGLSSFMQLDLAG